jgi:hypothetical protein
MLYRAHVGEIPAEFINLPTNRVLYPVQCDFKELNLPGGCLQIHALQPLLST